MRLSVTGVIDPTTRQEIIVPEIELHVSPLSMSIQYRKNISRSRTRGGFVEEHFGDELDTFSVEGSTGGFFSLINGVNTLHRNKTLSMINFQEILAIYRNNACVYDDKGIIIAQGFVVLTWDNYRFNGQFVNFSWDETADSPFRYKFNFSFEVHRTTFDR
jgi:hypothetical protein